MRRLATLACLLVAAAAVVVGTAATADNEVTYFVELDNAFGLVEDSHVRVAGVEAGVIKGLSINEDKRALVEIEINLEGFGAFRKGSGETDRDGRDDTGATCSSEPQSLIAEFFLDCQPGTDGPRYDSGDVIPVEQTTIAVQPDLANNTLREPFRDRFRIILNEFGTGLAGRAEDLNAAIRRGAPALRETRRVIEIMARQNRTIAQLNTDNDTIMTQLAAAREDVGRFITNTRRSATVSARERESLRQQFNRLPVFLGELEPTMRQLGQFADEQTPLLQDLQQAAPHLREFAERLQPFAEASRPSLESLGEAAVTGRRAVVAARPTVSQMRRASRPLVPAASELAKLLSDLDDPERALEVDQRAVRETGRGEDAGYTGFENILNYVYYQSSAVSIFDQVNHGLRIAISQLSGPCGAFSSDYERATSEEDRHPDGGDRADAEPRHRCVSWLGPNQPDLTEPVDVPKYDPSVCPDGSTRPDICDPNDPPGEQTPRPRSEGEPDRPSQTEREVRTEEAPESDRREEAPGRSDDQPSRQRPRLPEPVQDILSLPERLLGGEGRSGEGLLGGLLGGGGDRKTGDERSRDRSDRRTMNDLLEYLFAN